jgi:hypothetical protein
MNRHFRCEYDMPPLRAIYWVDVEAENENEARKKFFLRFHDVAGVRLRKVTEM